MQIVRPGSARLGLSGVPPPSFWIQGEVIGHSALPGSPGASLILLHTHTTWTSGLDGPGWTPALSGYEVMSDMVKSSSVMKPQKQDAAVYSSCDGSFPVEKDTRAHWQTRPAHRLQVLPTVDVWACTCATHMHVHIHLGDCLKHHSVNKQAPKRKRPMKSRWRLCYLWPGVPTLFWQPGVQFPQEP